MLIAAVLYSSVGHGGASAYISILVLGGLGRPEIAPVVLALNILVSTIGLFNYYRAGHFSLRLLLPFVVASIPAAFLGGMIQISQEVFAGVLGVTLLAASIRFLMLRRAIEPHPPSRPAIAYWVGLPAVFALGFLAGLVGVGGGIFLSPLILILGWADAKKTAAVSAAFINLNSVSGLLAHSLREPLNWGLLFPLSVVVMIGGTVGSWWGAFRIHAVTLQRLLGIVLLAASVKLFLEFW